MNPEASTEGINTTDSAPLITHQTTDAGVSSSLLVAAEFFPSIFLQSGVPWVALSPDAARARRQGCCVSTVCGTVPAAQAESLAAPGAIPHLWQDMENVSSLVHNSKHIPLDWLGCFYQPTLDQAVCK